MISNISTRPKTMFKNALNIQDFSFKSHTSTAIIVQPLLAQMVLENQRLSTLF
ncbi:hypothetical protein ckin34_14390 [Helicobacter pylori]